MIEFSEAVEELIDTLESEERELSEREQVVMDVIEVVRLIDEEGLHEFWFGPLNCEQSIKALDEIAAYEIVDHIQSSQWVQSASEDRNDFSETEAEHLAEIEEELYEKLEDVSELIEEYLEEE